MPEEATASPGPHDVAAPPLQAPANLPPPRTTPTPTPVNVAATVRGVETAAAFSGPEYVRAYLSARKEQLREQKQAAVAMREQYDNLAARQRELRRGLGEDEGEWSGGLGHSTAGHVTGGSRRSVRFSDAVEPLPLRLPMTPEEVGELEESRNAAAEADALRHQVSELAAQLERERAHTKRMLRAQVVCPHCEECVPVV